MRYKPGDKIRIIKRIPEARNRLDDEYLQATHTITGIEEEIITGRYSYMIKLKEKDGNTRTWLVFPEEIEPAEKGKIEKLKEQIEKR